VDALDRAILRRLQQDGRQTNRDLAEAVGIAPSTALERTRALRARGVITGVHAAIDPVALGRSVQALVGVRIRPQSRETIESVRDSVAKMPETSVISCWTSWPAARRSSTCARPWSTSRFPVTASRGPAQRRSVMAAAGG